MTLRITGRHVEITDEIRSYIEKKLPRIEKYADRIQAMDIVLEKDRYQFKSELRLKSGPVEVANMKDPDLMKSVDLLVDKVERQMKKKWEKVRGNKKHTGETAHTGVAAAARAAEAAGPEEEEAPGAVATATRRRKSASRTMPVLAENVGVHIFLQPPLSPRTMSLEEAAEELYFTDENFLCFFNSENRELNIMFRRKDGNFGVFEAGRE